jgi:hypothetical protein
MNRSHRNRSAQVAAGDSPIDILWRGCYRQEQNIFWQKHFLAWNRLLLTQNFDYHKWCHFRRPQALWNQKYGPQQTLNSYQRKTEKLKLFTLCLNLSYFGQGSRDQFSAIPIDAIKFLGLVHQLTGFRQGLVLILFWKKKTGQSRNKAKPHTTAGDGQIVR